MDTMSEAENYCLRWNDFEHSLVISLLELQTAEDFFDVTLVCGDSQLKAHKLILSSVSPIFRNILRQSPPHQHPMIYLRGIDFDTISRIVEFMYKGEVHVQVECLGHFIKVAEDLKVKGLTRIAGELDSNKYSTESESETSSTPKSKKKSSAGFKRPATEQFLSPSSPKVQKEDVGTEDPLATQYSRSGPIKEEVLQQTEEGANQTDSLPVEELHYGDYEQEYPEHIEYEATEVEEHQPHVQSPSDPGWSQTSDTFICSVCGKGFTSKKSKQNHMSLHKGITSCQLCQKTFSTTSNLNAHMRNSHPLFRGMEPRATTGDD